jgi:hypothetical protein
MLTWDNVADDLRDAIRFVQWRDAAARLEQKFLGESLVHVRAFEAFEAPHIERIESAIEQWLTKRALPELGDETSYLLALRFHVVAFLLASFDGVLPAPHDGEIPALYQAFLIEWWRKVGANYAVGFSHAEDDPES